MTAAADTPNVAASTEGHWTRDFVVYTSLMLCLVAVHFLVVGKLKSPEQEAVFDWPGLAAIGGAGLVGVVLARLARLRGPWDADLGLGEKLWKPLVLGLVAGGAALGIDHVTGVTAKLAARLGMQSIHIDFPVSIPIYYGASILVTILYFSVLIPLAVWLVSGVLLKGRHQGAVFWVTGGLCMLIEPITQGSLAAAAGDPNEAAYLVPGLVLEFLHVLFLRRAGLVASIVVRVGYYTFSHIIAGLLAGAY